MGEVLHFREGGYRCISGVFQYSAGVAANSGHEIHRARFMRPLPLLEGFRAARAYLTSIGRPSTSLAACELRSPAPLTEQGFYEFNRRYISILEEWRLYKDGKNPVARTNVCPEYGRVSEPMLYAFSYTVPIEGQGRGFIIAGSGEAQEGKQSYEETIVAFGDTSCEGMRKKVRFVMAEMERRVRALDLSWADAVSTRAYTIHDIGALIRDEIVSRIDVSGAVEWHLCRPPVVNLEYEMDVHGAVREVIL